MRTTLLSTALLLAGVFGYGQLKLPKIKKNNRFKIEQKKEVATDTINSFKVSTATPIEPKQHSFEELEAQHKKGYDIEHKLHRYVKKNPNDIPALYLYAQVSNSWDSHKAINHCIETNPENLNYRKVRAKKLLHDKATEEELLLAISDLELVNANGGEHHKTHAGIGWAHHQLAQHTLRWRKPTIEKDPFGDNAAFNEAQTAIHQRRLEHYQKARKHYEIALDMGATSAPITKGTLPNIDAGIAELEESIAEQPHKN